MGGKEDVHKHVNIEGEGIAADAAAGDLLTETVPAGDDDVDGWSCTGERGEAIFVLVQVARDEDLYVLEQVEGEEGVDVLQVREGKSGGVLEQVEVDKEGADVLEQVMKK